MDLYKKNSFLLIFSQKYRNIQHQYSTRRVRIIFEFFYYLKSATKCIEIFSVDQFAPVTELLTNVKRLDRRYMASPLCPCLCRKIYIDIDKRARTLRIIKWRLSGSARRRRRSFSRSSFRKSRNKVFHGIFTTPFHDLFMRFYWKILKQPFAQIVASLLDRIKILPPLFYKSKIFLRKSIRN